MEQYKADFSVVLADSESLFFKGGLSLKDGRDTPYFVNIGSFGNKASLSWELAKAYAGMVHQQMEEGLGIDIVFGPSYKASMLACDTTTALLLEHEVDLGRSYDRKEAKTHGEGSKQANMIVGAKLFDGARVYLIDDVGTSMKTKYEGIEFIADQSSKLSVPASIVGIGIAVDREQVGPVYDESKAEDTPNKDRVIHGERGEDAIGKFVATTGTPVKSIVGITEVVDFLYQSGHPVLIDGEKKLMDAETYDKFQEYMAMYGVER